MRFVSESELFALCFMAFPTIFLRTFPCHVFSTSDTTPNEHFCTTYELNLLQAGIGRNLTTSNLIPSIVGGFAGNTNLTKSLVCTKCAEGAYAVVRPQVNNQTQQLLDEYFSSHCGSSSQGTVFPAFLDVLCFS